MVASVGDPSFFIQQIIILFKKNIDTRNQQLKLKLSAFSSTFFLIFLRIICISSVHFLHFSRAVLIKANTHIFAESASESC
jgi:hypothetical protein